MVKMVALKDTKADKKHGDDPEGPVPPGNELLVHLHHDHLKKMGGPLPHGTRVEFGGNGEVTEVGTHDTPDGPRHHMTIKLHHAGVEAEDDNPDNRRSGLRGDIEAAAKQREVGKPATGKKVAERK